jgi:NADH-quinone oxidoreductase subunit H
VLFLGGWRGPYAEQYPLLGGLYFMIKAWAVYFVNVWMRASFPRFRIDQMMAISWKMLTPLAIAVVILTALVDKLLPLEGMLRVGVMLAVNLVLVVAAILMLNLQRRKQPLQEFPVAPSSGFTVKDVNAGLERGAK